MSTGHVRPGMANRGKMRIGDYVIQWWRMHVAAPWIQEGSRILDIGCHQGEFIKMLGRKIVPSVGMDPLYQGLMEDSGHLFLSREFRPGMPFGDSSFDVAVLLATIEHIQQKSMVAKELRRLLKRNGLVIITVPSLLVDKLLSILLWLGLVDGMSLEEHHGFSPDELQVIFLEEGFRLKKRQKFQFGLNNLYIFELP
jgi:2-polyprenyl-3-methyl-5-hydroxy-6-metoxy-1,4-benzoquinol methylase